MNVLDLLRKAFQYDIFGQAKEPAEQLSLVHQKEAQIGDTRQFGPHGWRMLLMSPSGKARWMDMTELDQTIAHHTLNQKEHEEHSRSARSQAITPLIPYAKYTQQDVFDKKETENPEHMQLGDLYFGKENPPPQHLLDRHKQYMERHQQHIDAAKEEERKIKELQAAKDILKKKTGEIDTKYKPLTKEEQLRDARQAIQALGRYGIIMQDLGNKYRLRGKLREHKKLIERIPGKRWDPYTGTYTFPKERVQMIPALFKSNQNFFTNLFERLNKSKEDSLFDTGEYETKAKVKHTGTVGVRWPWEKGHIGEIRDFGLHDRRQLEQTSNGVMRWISVDTEYNAGLPKQEDSQLGIDFSNVTNITPPKTPAIQPKKQKEAWQMTQTEFATLPDAEKPATELTDEEVKDRIKTHKQMVEHALANGKEIPQKVLAAYPDLQKQEPTDPIHKEATALGLRYEGAQKDARGNIASHQITDPENYGTFGVKPGETVAANLARHRNKWRKSLQAIFNFLFKSKVARSSDLQLDLFQDIIPTGTIKNFSGTGDIRKLEPSETNPLVRRWKDIPGNTKKPHTRGPAIKFNLRSVHRSEKPSTKAPEIWQKKKSEYLKDKAPALIKVADDSKLKRATGLDNFILSSDQEGNQTIIPQGDADIFSPENEKKIVNALQDQGLFTSRDFSGSTMGQSRFPEGRGFRIVPGDIHELVHRNAVKNAWLRGAEIPEEVLSDYPEYSGETSAPESSSKIENEQEEPERNVFNLKNPKHIEILRKINERLPEGAEILPDPETGLPFRSDFHVLRQMLRDMGYKFQGALLSGDSDQGISEASFSKSLITILGKMIRGIR